MTMLCSVIIETLITYYVTFVTFVIAHLLSCGKRHLTYMAFADQAGLVKNPQDTLRLR